MKRWMQSVPLKRAYTVSTLGYTLPLLVIAIVLVFVAHGTVVGSRRDRRAGRRLPQGRHRADGEGHRRARASPTSQRSTR